MAGASAVSMLSYKAPRWAAKLKNMPASFIKLAHRPTPIQEWQLDEATEPFKLYIKRDDQTGNLLSGNKVRKLEFILADAILKGSSCVITCGGLQSNHCRATAVAARRLGLKCHLLLRSHNLEEDAKVVTGNMLLNRIHGAKCHIVKYQSLAGGLNAKMLQLADELKKQGEIPYIIPLGGSNNLGTFGIISSFLELMEQDVLKNFDDIVLATGSGGTLAGLAVANYLTGEKLRVHGVCVSDDADYFYKFIEENLLTYGMKRAKARQICDVIEGYKQPGYSRTTPEDLDLLVTICQQSGILLDYAYTLKAVKGMLGEMKTNPSRFKGNRVLYIHTGGTFSIFDGTVNDILKQRSENIHVWNDDEITEQK